VEIASPDGSRRTINLDALYAGAAADPHREVRLGASELITGVLIPPGASGLRQHWEKVMQRGAWDFALVSCAGAHHADGSVRIALGGVALGPWRIAQSVEEDVASGGLDDESIDALAERVMYDVAPLPLSAYKVEIAKSLLRSGMAILR
jgi:xanthine dehydrogenase YagS FAD-binding subunit